MTKSRFIAIIINIMINNDHNKLNVFYFIPFLLSVGKIAKWREGKPNSYSRIRIDITDCAIKTCPGPYGS